MTTKPTPDPKSRSAPALDHGCCGDKPAAQSHNGASKLVDSDHHQHIVPSKVAESSCCGGSTKDSGPADPRGRSVPSK